MGSLGLKEGLEDALAASVGSLDANSPEGVCVDAEKVPWVPTTIACFYFASQTSGI